MLDIMNCLKDDNVQEANPKKHREHKKNLRELVELATLIVEFHPIEKIFPAKMSPENYFKDKKGRIIQGILVGQLPNFKMGCICEVGDSCQFHGLIKEAFLLRNGRWKIFESKITCFSDGKQNQMLFLREESEDQSLDDFDLENLVDLVKIRINEQVTINNRSESLDSMC